MKFLPILLLLIQNQAFTQTDTCQQAGRNLLRNGDFEQGYFGFTSDFGRGSNNATLVGCSSQGWILVGKIHPHVNGWTCVGYPADLSAQYGKPNSATHPDPAHPSNTSVATTCQQLLPDHTTGTGLCLTVDPDYMVVQQRAYWKQKVRVCPQTDYLFSVWVQNISGLPAPRFHFEIGGQKINDPTDYPKNEWVRTAKKWNSGALDGIVELKLVNDIPGCIANDVAIDDIFFGLCDEQSTVFSTVETKICAGENHFGHSTSGIFVDTIRTPCGADSIRTLILEVAPSSFEKISTTICPGEQTIFNGKIFSESGIFRDTFQNQFGCDSILELDLHVRRREFLPADTTLCLANFFEIKSPSAATVWFDNSTAKTKIVNEAGTFSAALIDSAGCLLNDSIRVQFSHKVFIPNAFRPRSTAGLNDVFRPFFSNLEVENYRLQVFDRWGGLVFAAAQPDQFWDGRAADGRNCQPGVYLFLIEIETLACGRVVLRGDVSVLD